MPRLARDSALVPWDERVNRGGLHAWAERPAAATKLAAMRLVHMADYGGPYAGSFIPTLIGIMREAEARGWDREIVFTQVAEGRPWLAELEKEGIQVHFAPSGTRSQLMRWIQRLLRERHGPTLLHTHFTTFDLPALGAARRRSDVKVLWHIHSAHSDRLTVRARNTVKYVVGGRRVAMMLCVSNDVADAVRRRGGPARKVLFFPNAIDANRFAPITDGERRAARVALELPDDAAVLLHFGWDWRRKGGDIFLDAVRLLCERNPQVVGLTVGGGAEAQASCQAIGLGARVRVIGPTNDVRMLYAAADVFVACSRAEGTPFSVLEALSSGIPVVASNLTGHLAIAEHVDACLIVNLSAEAVAEAVASLVESGAGRFPGTHEAVRAVFDLEAWSQRLAHIYEQLLEHDRLQAANR
jgi:glycosyltransferase involved in cell wall biosynthesis